MSYRTRQQFCARCQFYEFVKGVRGEYKTCTKFNATTYEERYVVCGGKFKEKAEIKYNTKAEGVAIDKRFSTNELTLEQLYRYFDCLKKHKRFYINDCDEEEISEGDRD